MRFDRFDRKEAGWTVGGRPVQPASGGRLGRCGPPQPAQLCRLSRLEPVLPEASRRPGRPPGPLRPAAGRFDRDGAAPPPPRRRGYTQPQPAGRFCEPDPAAQPDQKTPQPAFYYHTAVQVATVTLDYSGKRPAVHRHLVVLKVAEYARTCARSSLHNTVDTSAALRSVAARAHTETTPNHASAPPRKRKNMATQTQHQVTMLNCARGERVQERASSVHW